MRGATRLAHKSAEGRAKGARLYGVSHVFRTLAACSFRVAHRREAITVARRFSAKRIASQKRHGQAQNAQSSG